MTTRKDLVQDMEDAETILLALDGLREEIPEKSSDKGNRALFMAHP